MPHPECVRPWVPLIRRFADASGLVNYGQIPSYQGVSPPIWSDRASSCPGFLPNLWGQARLVLWFLCRMLGLPTFWFRKRTTKTVKAVFHNPGRKGLATDSQRTTDGGKFPFICTVQQYIQGFCLKNVLYVYSIKYCISELVSPCINTFHREKEGTFPFLRHRATDTANFQWSDSPMCGWWMLTFTWELCGITIRSRIIIDSTKSLPVIKRTLPNWQRKWPLGIPVKELNNENGNFSWGFAIFSVLHFWKKVSGGLPDFAFWRSKA